MIILRDISLRRGTKALLEHTSVTLGAGERLAVIGANGCGKSSFFALLRGELGADSGDIDGLAGLRLSHMAQEAPATELNAQDYVIGGDANLAQLLNRVAAAEAESDFEQAAGLHAQIEAIDGYSAERRVQRLLLGLGFAQGDAMRPITDFSGGWRIRLNLARALMTPSDLMLLDEPTNHLDLDATLWLQQWLRSYPGTLLIISHDRDFIDASCNRILQLQGQQLHSYKGNYSDFERQRAERLANQQAAWDKQQRRIAEIDAFVARFRYKATKARQAQSRLKELERMQALAPAHVDSPFDFSFLPCPRSSDPMLSLKAADLGYGDTPVLRGVDLRLRPGSRIGLLGRNGAGKSTLLKSLIGELPLCAGERVLGDNCQIGYFDQQQLEALDLNASPLLHVQRLSPDAREQDIKNFLGGFDFRGDAATAAVAPFSGGEKARLALALVVWQQPNLLVLDEPTNHLDLEMRHALEMALQAFEGAVVLVSHDRHLLRNTVEELVLVHDGQVSDYEEDIAYYERWLLSREDNDAANDKPRRDNNRREQRQQAAAERARLRPLQKQITAVEKQLASAEQALQAVQEQLADNALYDSEHKDKLADLLRQESELKSQTLSCEEQWLALQEELEQLSQSDTPE
jgi:ATP-binding cassette subfamily F protein 3